MYLICLRLILLVALAMGMLIKQAFNIFLYYI